MYFFIAPAVSGWLERDIGYAWPLFCLAIPALFKARFPSSGITVALLLENCVAGWIPYTLITSPGHRELFAITALFAAVVMQAAALWTLRHRRAG